MTTGCQDIYTDMISLLFNKGLSNNKNKGQLILSEILQRPNPRGENWPRGGRGTLKLFFSSSMKNEVCKGGGTEPLYSSLHWERQATYRRKNKVYVTREKRPSVHKIQGHFPFATFPLFFLGCVACLSQGNQGRVNCPSASQFSSGLINCRAEQIEFSMSHSLLATAVLSVEIIQQC